MEKFDIDKEYFCPKCKAGAIEIKYIDYGKYIGNLRLTCAQCGYSWLMLSCDSDEGEKTDKDT